MAVGTLLARSGSLWDVPSVPPNTRPITGKDTYDGHALRPAVVRSKGQEEAISVGSELVGEVLGTSHDVETLRGMS